MFHFCNINTVRAALGAALFTLVAGCSDVPSGLRQPLPGLFSEEHAGELPSARGALEMPAVVVQQGEQRQQRVHRSADGHVYTFVAAARPSEAPRELLVLRDGQPMLHTINEWRHTAEGDVLERQQGMVFTAGAAPRYFDSHTQGLSQALRSQPVVLAHQAMESAAGDASAGEYVVGVRRPGGPSTGGFVCESEVRSFDGAADGLIGATVAYVAAYGSGNPWAIVTAASYLCGSVRAFERAADAVELCAAKY